MGTRRFAYIGSLILVILASQRSFAQETPVNGPANAPATATATATANANANATANATTVRRANEWLTAGEVAFSQGRFGDALDAFEASYRKLQVPHTLRRIGDAADKVGSYARAAEALQAYLKYVPDAPDREYIASRIDANYSARGVPARKSLAITEAPLTVPSDQQIGQPDSHRSQASDLSNDSESAAPTLATTQLRSEAARNPAGPVWMWAAGGAVLVAGIVIAAVFIAAGGSPSRPEPVMGNVGSAIQTLGSR